MSFSNDSNCNFRAYTKSKFSVKRFYIFKKQKNYPVYVQISLSSNTESSLDYITETRSVM